MTAIPLRLGPLALEGGFLGRSGLRWLHDDGYLCRAGEVVAFCNLGFGGQTNAFPEERFDLQVALAPRVAGRVRHAATASPGAILDRIPNIPWAPETVWAHLEPLPGGAAREGPADEPELLFLAGRRLTDAAEDRSGLFTGWHSRKRAWWGEGAGGSLLALGTCHQSALIRGDDGAFSSLFEAIAGPAQVVMPLGEPLAPCAAILNQQLARTPEQAVAIRQDMAMSFLAGGGAPPTSGWLFMGALQRGLDPASLDERYDLLTRTGLRRSPPASAICLSLDAEAQHLLRHRRLGYLMNIYVERLSWAGEAVREWLRRDFELVTQSPEDVARELRTLVESAPDRAFVVVNRISSRVNEAIQSYDGFDDATMAQLSSVHAQELNLVLHDLARAPNVEILDADAIAADLGVARHLPDGAHATGELQDALRAELLRLLRAQGVPGFVARGVSRC